MSISYGLIFDVDGVLTKPIKPNNMPQSIIDIDLIHMVSKLSHKMPVAFITGRSKHWLDIHLLEHLDSFSNDTAIFMEYGLVYLHDNKLKITTAGQKFRSEIYLNIINHVTRQAKEFGIFFEPEIVYTDYPDHGSMWVENKYSMLSLASNFNINPIEVQKTVEGLPKTILNKVRIINHHLGVDILPAGASKANAVKKFQTFEITKEVNRWYVFGDNPSDREMIIPLRNAAFIDTKLEASEKTKRFLLNKLY